MGQARHNMRWEKGNREIKHERKGWLKRGSKRAEDKNEEQDRVGEQNRVEQGAGIKEKKRREKRRPGIWQLRGQGKNVKGKYERSAQGKEKRKFDRRNN